MDKDNLYIADRRRDELYWDIGLRTGWLEAMALQVGSEDFGDWNKGIRECYAGAMTNAIEEIKGMIEALEQQEREPEKRNAA